MAGKGIERERHLFVYPKHAMKPTDFLTFIEMEGFHDEWVSLGLTDDDLALFQTVIMSAPTKNKEMPGAGGFRVVTLTRDRDFVTVHLGYVYFDSFNIALLVITQVGETFEMFTPEEKQEICGLIERERAALAKGKRK